MGYKIDLKEAGYEDTDCIYLAQDRKWIRTFGVSLKCGIFVH
jgi:hypothetical protein